MQRHNMVSYRRHQHGQTLVIAILVLGVLLILGTVFATLISRNITDTGRSRNRTIASDLAESGVRYAHYQLQHSSSGADWRPQFVQPAIDGAGFTRDPDALYMRPASGLTMTGFGFVDQGGPDGYGPYTRIEFDRGRALVRVRYAPMDTTNGLGSGNLRQPGKVRSQLIIESVGRAGKVRATDPTTMLKSGVQVASLTTQAQLDSTLSTLKTLDLGLTETRKLLGIAQIGLTDYARSVWNIFKVTQPAEFGSPVAGPGGDTSGLGISYADALSGGIFTAIPVVIRPVMGGDLLDSSDAIKMTGGGSMYVGANLSIYGVPEFYMDPSRGDGLKVAGNIRPANTTSGMILHLPSGTLNLNAAQIDSGNGGFLTQGGVIRDGVPDSDSQAFARGISTIEAPNILETDPVSGQNRYLPLTRDSGVIVNGINVGRYGYGQGVYVDCTERENIPTESDREKTGAARSIVQDWLNPNQDTGSGWEGPYYRPIAPLVLMNPEGFTVIRDSKATRRFWRAPNGSQTNRSTIRYRLLNGLILDDISFPNLSTATLADFQANGRPFNGVLYFEGDCRVRGVIPTDYQVSFVAMGTIYIDGSITKGVVDNTGAPLNRPSTSMCALLARDYVALNTTAFFAPEASQAVSVKKGDATQSVPRSIELDAANGGQVNLRAQFLLNNLTDAASTAQAGNPSTWKPYALNYLDSSTNAKIYPKMLMQHSADNGGPTFISLMIQSMAFHQISAGLNAYLFESGTLPSGAVVNAPVRNYFTPNDGSLIHVPNYGLADGGTNIYPKFETSSFPLMDSNYNFALNQIGTAGSPMGLLRYATQDETQFRIQTAQVGPVSAQNYLLSKFAVTPYDVRIDALIYAQEGSFFVIPGPAFNSNSSDSRQAFVEAVASLGGVPAAQADRLQRTGNGPEVPFYNEPQNVRVTINGVIAENMPAPMSAQVAWQRLWGWMPRYIGSSGNMIPKAHVPAGYNVVSGANLWVPNLNLNFDPALAFSSADGTNPIRRSPDGLWALPPLPKLPVSPSLAYFGEVNP